MTRRFLRISLSTLLLGLMVLACNITATGGTPTIVYVPVTVTSEPAQTQPVPTNTIEPLPTAYVQPTATTVEASPTPDVLHFYVSGTVWEDQCPYIDGPLPNPLPTGCVQDAGSGKVSANGTYDSGEPGIAGVTVKLEINCTYGAFTTVTDANGHYNMSFTVPKSAGVNEQKICLSIDALSPENTPILIPGGWTSPAATSATALVQLTIPVETPNTVNFGWDYQFK